MYKFGDIVLIAFPFTDGYGVKKRPALVILDTGDHDVLLARITSQYVSTDFDIQIAEWEEAGLLTRSYVRLHKLATIETVLIDRRLGKLSPTDLAEIKQKLSDIYTGI